MIEPGLAGSGEPRLSQIVEAILRIADMDFETLLVPSPQRDEIDAIMVGINTMAAELAATYTTLDYRVEDRTRKLAAARDQMERLAFTDPLTGLANRSALILEIEKTAAGLEQDTAAPIVMLLDLDAFKSINDNYGHAVGDKVLCRMAERLRGCVRTEDVVARLGGDEFAVLIRMPEHGAMGVGQRIAAAMNEDMVIDDIHLSPGTSLGLVRATAGRAADQLLLEADTAMYAAKRSPRENVVEFEPFMLFERQQKAEMIANLRSALGTEEFIPAYQALVYLEDERISGAEVLVRWQRPGHGLMAPGEFLPTAEEAGMVGELTQYLLHRALRDVKQWREQGLVDDDFKVHLNVTSRELHQLEFADLVRAAVRQHDLPACILSIEITEDRLMSGDSLHQYTLRALRAMGVEVFIDDFGTGYSSISYLRQLPVSGVKIDKSLVADIAEDSRQVVFLRAIADLINACDLKCVVEGVETVEQSARLKAMNFKTVQGYLYGRPVVAAEFAKLLSARALAADPAAGPSGWSPPPANRDFRLT